MKGKHLNIIKFMLITFFLFVLFATPVNTFSQSRENLLKAGYIEKFIQFVEWPVKSGIDDPNTPFTIAVFGKDEFENALEKIFGKIRVKNKNVHIKYISSPGEIDNALVLVITKSEKNRIDEVLRFTSAKPILTIGDTKGFAKKGIMINLFIDKNYLRYEINQTSVNKSGLKISSLLLTSAILVKSDE
ncbi:MAG: YfiR family protein [Ignavibacteriales bacterium]|nr:MAG: YfiR family protein [Ignavibacteriales bacterium]